jgi:citrate/tricarballylate utilization protein
MLSADGLRQGSGESRRSDSKAELLRRGEHVMTVCNACRYCEAYCPVFQAMENRTAFATGDMLYLANLCHNCGECLYACQYAPPHEFGINVPRVMAEVRASSYEEYCWPRFMKSAFRRNGVAASLALAAASMFFLWPSVQSWATTGDFYGVISHDAMVGVFGLVGLFVVVVLAIGVTRAWHSYEASTFVVSTFGGPEGAAKAGYTDVRAKAGHYVRALQDVLTLRHLHGSGTDCTSDVEQRSPWRRWFHHCTYYGFLLCFASTSIAAIYHVVFGWRAPYAYGSAPVVLGTLGGVGLMIGPLGLLALRRRRDPQMTDPAQRGLDESFIVMLCMTSVTGLLLLGLRDRPAMPALLIVHLGFVLGLFLTLPYGKFVHGLYRVAALLRFSAEAYR